MSSAERELEAAALALPRSERARLAERLLASLDEESEIEEAWRVEVERRLARYRSGELQGIPASSVHEEAARRLKRQVEIRYLPPAQDEFLAALEFYESEAPGLGAEFDEEVREVEARLSDFRGERLSIHWINAASPPTQLPAAVGGSPRLRGTS